MPNYFIALSDKFFVTNNSSVMPSQRTFNIFVFIPDVLLSHSFPTIHSKSNCQANLQVPVRSILALLLHHQTYIFNNTFIMKWIIVFQIYNLLRKLLLSIPQKTGKVQNRSIFLSFLKHKIQKGIGSLTLQV